MSLKKSELPQISPDRLIPLDDVTTIEELEALIAEHGPWLVDARKNDRTLLLGYRYREYHDERDLYIEYQRNGLLWNVAAAKLQLNTGLCLLRKLK